ncbi:MAG: hypothetical protein COZ90_01130 [Candidatus Nealsonbacteria bacterium CG_4_8_14_3_um_filter_37_36]|uniref:DUF362 domain-containing protein n=3 Tax=Candidatus Nealsoniibacteriota TaxID=1817911 RepID=A0A2H9N193_9BACT|nr:MAG: hypothetical protein COZ90_01130 [Candidatus Nealsonbacteria bacterium CG_4_8_14_3_um_filter_37_36]
MFYRCSKCKKIWQYPIERCPDCFSDLERIKSEKIKVIGISKVTIPTIFHQKIPYFVLVLEDENGNKWTQKSIKEYKIGDLFKVEPCTDKNAVAIWRIKYDILEAIEKVIELLGGPPPNLGWGTKILILPTLVSPKHPYLAINTNPKFLESLIKYLIEIGGDVKNIKVAAQSFDETPIEASAQKSQLLNVCLQNQITPLDLAKTNFVKKTQDGLTFEISEEVLNSDLIINLPILKLDSKLGVRGATENILKFLKKESYLSLQYLHSQEEIMTNMPGVLPNFLTIADGQTIQKTTGFTAFLGVILASFNPFNLDRTFAEITMVSNLPGYLKKIKIEDIPIVGRKVEEVQYSIEKLGV